MESYGYAPNMGTADYPIFVAFPVLIVGGGCSLIRRYTQSSSDEERNRLIYLTIGAAFPLTGVSLDALSNLPPVAIWTNLAFCMISSVAIVRYHLLDVRLVVRKSLVYLFVSFLIALPYVVLLLVATRILGTNFEPWPAYFLGTFIVALMLRPLYGWAQRTVDRLFYRERYDYLVALEDFLQQTHDIRNLDEMASSLVNLIGRALQCLTVRLFISSASGGFAEVPSANGGQSAISISEDSGLTRWIRRTGSVLGRKELAFVPQLQSLTRSETSLFRETKAELLVPIATRTTELIGFIILGGK